MRFAGAGTPTSAGGGYVYLRNRWYDPQTGRFLSQDPIGLAGGVNLYAYAGNNPASYSDPFGLCKDPSDPDCKTMGQRVADAFTKKAEALLDAPKRTVAALKKIFGGAAKGLADNASASIDVTAGPTKVAFAADAVAVAEAPSVGLHIVATISVENPTNHDTPGTISVGHVFGEGFVGGGSLDLNTQGWVRASGSVGLGISFPVGGKVGKYLEKLSVLVGKQNYDQ
jgi:RHS repeat-associated protein